MYKLRRDTARHFNELFEQIDRDLVRYGIRNYTIRNMTLEQVFIAIAEEELKNDNVEDQEVNSDQIRQIEQMPEL